MKRIRIDLATRIGQGRLEHSVWDAGEAPITITIQPNGVVWFKGPHISLGHAEVASFTVALPLQPEGD